MKRILQFPLRGDIFDFLISHERINLHSVKFVLLHTHCVRARRHRQGSADAIVGRLTVEPGIFMPGIENACAAIGQVLPARTGALPELWPVKFWPNIRFRSGAEKAIAWTHILDLGEDARAGLP
jgi:hypothetical protein